MKLTEEEKDRLGRISAKYIWHSKLSQCQCDGCFLEDKIIRLVKENEDYFCIIEERGVQITNLCDQLDAIKNWSPVSSRGCVLCTYHDGVFIESCSYHQEIDRLRTQLEAIKKAWGETLIKYNLVAHHFSFVCDEEIELGDAIDALDKLIGGE